MPAWDAGLYLKFSSERTQPSVDLARRIELDAPASIVDLGCGPGNSTAVLRRRWPTARLLGIDQSATMIQAARQDDPAGDWLVADLVTWRPASPVDLVFSNAVLQWVPKHEDVVPRLLSFVSPGGALAVQIPAHFDSPVHRTLLSVAGDPRWTARMDGARGALTVERPTFYYRCLRPLASRVVMWETTYLHVLESARQIVEWFKGTGLRPFLAPLEPAEQAAFIQAFQAELEEAYPLQADSSVLFPFPRLFFVAYR